MAIRTIHNNAYPMHFITFTCYRWIPFFEILNAHDLVYSWFKYLERIQVGVVAYVIMPNHVHAILYFHCKGYNLNKVIANAKRFMAIEIIRRLVFLNQTRIIRKMSAGVSAVQRKNGQIHRVFEKSFDAKIIYSKWFFEIKFNYIHNNPTKSNPPLCLAPEDFEHSSASFYETGEVKHHVPLDYRLVDFSFPEPAAL
jgi:REP element-mobilizing transposase RayT